MAQDPSDVILLGREGMVRGLTHCICRQSGERRPLASISFYSLFIFIQSRTSAHFQDGSSLLCSTSAPKTPSRAYSEMGVLGDSKSRWVGSEDVPSEFFYQKRKFN